MMPTIRRLRMRAARVERSGAFFPSPPDPIEPAEDKALLKKNIAAAKAFGAPVTVVIANMGDPRTATAAAVRAGLVAIGTEMAGGGTTSPEAVALCRR